MPEIYKTEGIIIRNKNYRESDRIITVFSKKAGKLRIIAKGVRKINSRRAGGVELFNHVLLSLNRNKEIETLLEVSVISSYQDIKKDLKKIGIMYYFCELVDKLTSEGQENELIFNLLKKSFISLEHGNYTVVVRNFEESLLNDTGFGIPENTKKKIGSLKDYIEQVAEKKINSPKIIKEIW